MRMDIVVTSAACKQTGPLSLILKTRGTRETFKCETDISSLVTFLKSESGLPSYAVDLFFRRLSITSREPLYGVRLSDDTLQKLGFFLD